MKQKDSKCASEMKEELMKAARQLCSHVSTHGDAACVSRAMVLLSEIEDCVS